MDVAFNNDQRHALATPRSTPRLRLTPPQPSTSLHAIASLTFALTFKLHPSMVVAPISMVGHIDTQQIALIRSTERSYCSNKHLFTSFLHRTIGELTRTHLPIQADSKTLW